MGVGGGAEKNMIPEAALLANTLPKSEMASQTPAVLLPPGTSKL